jgi:hypothetical protein
MYGNRKDTFTLNDKKIRIIQEMHNKIGVRNECCPFLGECFEEVYSCYLPEYAGLCYYRTLIIDIKPHPCPIDKIESIIVPAVKYKNTIQKCKR